jgi:hypothetical protein
MSTQGCHSPVGTTAHGRTGSPTQSQTELPELRFPSIADPSPAAPSQHKHDIHKFRTITKLAEDNWVSFKFEARAALEERALWEVTTEDLKPDKKVSPDAYRIWKDQDISAKAQIIQNLTKDVQPLLFDCESAYDVWKALQDEY